MGEVIIEFVGSYAGGLAAGSVAVMVLARQRIRAWHVQMLAGIAVFALLAFAWIAFAAVSHYRATSSESGLAGLLLGVFIVTGSACLGWLALRVLGLVPQDDQRT